MLRTAQLRRDHKEAGSLNNLIAVWGFVDDYTFITKAGDLGVVFELTGVDCEGLDANQRQTVIHSFETALRALNSQFRIYQHLTRRRCALLSEPEGVESPAARAVRARTEYLNQRRAHLYDVSLHIVILYEGLRTAHTLGTRAVGTFGTPGTLGTHPGTWHQALGTLKSLLSTSRQLNLVSTDIDEAIARLRQVSETLAAHLSDTLRPQRLRKGEVFQFLRSLVNYAPEKANACRLVHDTHVDYFVADSPIECHRTHLDVDGAAVRVLVMKEPPAHTFANLLAPLYTLPGEFIACLEWRRIEPERMRRDLTIRRRHFFNRRVSLVNYISPDTRSEDMLVDQSAGAIVRQLGEALTEVEVNNHFFGECSLTLVLIDRDRSALAKTAGEAVKLMGAHDGTLAEETYNLLNAWLAVVPGNHAHNLRRLALLETNYADLSFLFTLNQGEPTSPHLGRPALAIFETRHRTPYHYNLHIDDIGHTVILGATGSGKSFLLNFLLTHAKQYDPFTVVFDLGHSYRKLAELLGGSYLELGLRRAEPTINPFALVNSPENLHFLHAFARVLVEGRSANAISDAEDGELYEAIESLYVLDRSQRRLSTLASLLPRQLARRLEPWVDGGRYASMFDNVNDTVSICQFQVLALDDMQAYPELLEPLLFYVLHRVTAEIQDPHRGHRLKIGVLDEAWRFIQHERLRAYVAEALKTWRKHNAAMLLATQSIEDFASVDLLRTVIEGCPTKLLLANPSLDVETYKSLFKLNEAELDLVLGLAPRREFLLKRQHLAKVLTLNVDPRSYWLYTNTPMDNARLASAVQEFGFEAALDRLASTHL